MFKIAYGAGHNLYTTGRRIPKALDGNETKEWVLNDRVARYFAEAAGQYEDVELLRVDDPAGQAAVDLYARSRKANEWGADFCLAIHQMGALTWVPAAVWKPTAIRAAPKALPTGMLFTKPVLLLVV